MTPDLASAPGWGLLLTADAVLGPPGEAPRLISRGLSEVVLPEVSDAEVRALSESGALWAAGEGLIEEEDLAFLAPSAGDADALGRRSHAAGTRDWTRPGTVRAFQVAEILDLQEDMGLEAGTFALVIFAGAEDLGRLAFSGHRERILARTASGDFGDPSDLPAAPIDTEEARDLLAAAGAATNYAAGRAALVVHALRKTLEDQAGPLSLRAAWSVGGLEERTGTILHRYGLAAAKQGEALISGQSVAAGTGAMLGSAPPFEVPEEDGQWPWEEAGILERRAILKPL